MKKYNIKPPRRKRQARYESPKEPVSMANRVMGIAFLVAGIILLLIMISTEGFDWITSFSSDDPSQWFLWYFEEIMIVVILVVMGILFFIGKVDFWKFWTERW